MNNIPLYIPEELASAFSREINGVDIGLIETHNIQLEITRLESAILENSADGDSVVNIGALYSELQAVYACRTGKYPLVNPKCVEKLTESEINISVAKLLCNSDLFMDLFMRSIYPRLKPAKKRKLLNLLQEVDKKSSNNLN